MSGDTPVKIVGTTKYLLSKPPSTLRFPPKTNFAAAGLDVAQHFVHVLLVDQRVHIGGFVEWHADFDPSRACGEALHELAGDLILDDQPSPLDAFLALIEDIAEEDAIECRIDIGIGDTTLAALPPSSRLARLSCSPAVCAILRPTSLYPVKDIICTSG